MSLLWSQDPDERAANDHQKNESRVMQVTTSRKPSDGTRRLARTLAEFLVHPYITRGKLSLDRDSDWIVVVEKYGNPSGFERRTEEGDLIFPFRLSFERRIPRTKRERPVIVGRSDTAKYLASFFDLDIDNGDKEIKAKRVIKVSDNHLDFIVNGEMILKLLI